MKDVTLITYPAADMAKAKQFFGELTGTDPYADSPYYVGYKSGNVEIGLVPSQGASAIAFWNVSDIAASVKALVDAGGTVVQDPTDVANGLLVATVKEPSGTVVGLRQFPKN
ncbi:MAG TPA: VOC family protein [Verrucomicrobiae bacterium]|nr:VOC family protein [Verrucomicrobiae bacterium]